MLTSNQLTRISTDPFVNTRLNQIIVTMIGNEFSIEIFVIGFNIIDIQPRECNHVTIRIVGRYIQVVGECCIIAGFVIKLKYTMFHLLEVQICKTL
jgi:hypothetical protein